MTITTNEYAPALPARPGFALTKRERQILSLVMQGLSNRQIADHLGLKYYTVTTHLKNIYKKVGLHKRAAVVAKVLTKTVPRGRISRNET